MFLTFPPLCSARARTYSPSRNGSFWRTSMVPSNRDGHFNANQLGIFVPKICGKEIHIRRNDILELINILVYMSIGYYTLYKIFYLKIIKNYMYSK
jgi:hypothetical protein